MSTHSFMPAIPCLLIKHPVPLYWNQQGMALKPAPQLNPDRTHDQNLHAIQQHLSKTASIYGPLVRMGR